MGSITIFDYAIALILFAAGTAVLGFFLYPFIRAVNEIFRGSAERRRLNRTTEKLNQIDAHLDAQDWRQALSALRGSLVTEQFVSREAIRQVREHNQNVLSRAVVLAEELSTRAENLAEVERLVIENAEIQLLYLKSMESFTRLKAKRREASKGMPDWTKSDFEKRTKEILAELKHNQSAISRSFEALLRSLEQPRADEVTYH